MSKMDDLRAMREARFEQRTTGAAKPAAARKAAKATADPGPDTTEGALCGHRAISGRTCTRERGHSAKSHRYS